jgi:hypothetical protein
MSLYDEILNEGQLAKGDHLTMLKSIDMKVSKNSGNEYLNLIFKTKEGEIIYHNLSFSKKAVPMLIKQLKNIKIVAALPIYASVDDLVADGANFIRKVMTLMMDMVGKKFIIKVTGYDDNNRPKTWIEKYADIENKAVQRDVPKAAVDPRSVDTISDSDEIPF